MAGLIRPSAISLLIKAGNVALGLGLSVVLARLCGPEGYGQYVLAFSIVTLLAVPAQLGLPALIVRETARARHDGMPAAIRTLLRWAHRTTLTLSALTAVGLGAYLLIRAASATEVSATIASLAWGICLLPLIGLAALRGAALRGLGHVLIGQLPEAILRPGLLILLLLGVATGTQPTLLSPATAMALHVLAAALAFGVGTALLVRRLPTIPSGASAAPDQVVDRRAWLRASLTLGLLSAVTIVNSNVDVLFLGALWEDEATIAVYKVAVLAAGLLATGTFAVNQVLMPRLAALSGRENRSELQALVTQATRMIFALAVGAAVVLALAGGWVLDVLYGPEYRGAYPLLLILIAGQLANAFCGPVGAILNMSGHERDTLTGFFLSLLTNAAMNAMLIPAYGAVGAAIATATAMVVWNGILWARVRRRLGIDSTPFGRRHDS